MTKAKETKASFLVKTIKLLCAIFSRSSPILLSMLKCFIVILLLQCMYFIYVDTVFVRLLIDNYTTST